VRDDVWIYCTNISNGYIKLDSFVPFVLICSNKKWYLISDVYVFIFTKYLDLI